MAVYKIMAVIIVVAAIILYRHKKEEEKVPQGLQVFNADGDLMLDYTEATCQIYGTKTIVGSRNGSGTITDSRIKAGSTFIVPYNITLNGISTDTPEKEWYGQVEGIQPEFTISNGKITWKYGALSSRGAYIGMTILYGGRLS